VDDGGSSIAHLVLHMARHHDLAVTTAVRDHQPLFFAHKSRLGLDDAASSAGLSEREERETTDALSLDAMIDYLDAVFEHTGSWLKRSGTMMLDTVPDTSRRLAELAHLSEDEVGWLHRMWSGKPVWWLLQWPVIGHGHAHVGEATSVRNRMGLSPF
jgi:hypothetical protein